MNEAVQRVGQIGGWYVELLRNIDKPIFLHVFRPLKDKPWARLIFNSWYTEAFYVLATVIGVLLFGLAVGMAAIFFLPAAFTNTFPPIGAKLARMKIMPNSWMGRILICAGVVGIIWVGIVWVGWGWYVLGAVISVIAAKVMRPLYDRPMSAKRLGDHKTWGGFCYGMFMGTVIAPWLVYSLIPLFAVEDLSILVEFTILMAVYQSFFASCGDTIGSGIRRRVGLKSGEFARLNLIDWSVMVFIALLPFALLNPQYLPILLVSAVGSAPFGSGAAGLIAVGLGIKSSR